MSPTWRDRLAAMRQGRPLPREVEVTYHRPFAAAQLLAAHARIAASITAAVNKREDEDEDPADAKRIAAIVRSAVQR